MESSGLNGPQLSQRCGISASQIYNWINNVQVSVSEEQLGSLAPALSTDPAQHAALLAAHLLDEKKGPGSELVTIDVHGPTLLKDATKPRSRVEKAIAHLAAERHNNAALAELLIALARAHGAKL